MKVNWTEELLADCKRLYIEEGRSAAETARLLGNGLTRNSVVGQAHRRGWTKTHRQVPSAPKRTVTVRAAAKPKPFSKPAVTFGRTRPPPSEKELAALRAKQLAEGKKAMRQALQSANDNSVLLIARRFGQCAWPVGEPDKPEFQLCCGRAVPEDSPKPYCPDHRALSCGKVVSAKELQRSLRRVA